MTKFRVEVFGSTLHRHFYCVLQMLREVYKCGLVLNLTRRDCSSTEIVFNNNILISNIGKSLSYHPNLQLKKLIYFCNICIIVIYICYQIPYINRAGVVFSVFR